MAKLMWNYPEVELDVEDGEEDAVADFLTASVDSFVRVVQGKEKDGSALENVTSDEGEEAQAGE